MKLNKCLKGLYYSAFLATYVNTAILKIAVVTKHGIRDLQRFEAMVSLLKASEAGKLWSRG